MVGVPRSRGCSQCISRRIKCDETRPQCLRCTNRGTTCPGYYRARKFKDQTQFIIKKHGRSAMDERFAPNLAYEAISIQTRESFDTFLNHYFPSFAACVQSRLQVKWMEFLRSGWSTFPPALVWGVRALMALLMGASQGNKQAILCARHMYSRGIQHLAFLLQTQAALADETLAAAILLGGYEVLDGSGDRLWIVHARGIGQLMRARGPCAHEKGMGRTMLMCWRPYIIADAFIHGSSCFLGDPEWTHKSMTEEIARAENEQGFGSLIGQAADYAFNEVAKCPGYLAATTEIFTASKPISAVKLDSLMGDILKSKENLVRLERMLSAPEPSTNFVGVIPSRYATTWVQGSRGGVTTAIAFLDHLVAILQSITGCHNKSQWSASMVRLIGMHDDQALQLPPKRRALDGLAIQPCVIRDSDDMNLGTYAIGDRLDRFSLTMGMESLLPDPYGFPQFSAYDTIPGYFTTFASSQRF